MHLQLILVGLTAITMAAPVDMAGDVSYGKYEPYARYAPYATYSTYPAGSEEEATNKQRGMILGSQATPCSDHS